MKDSGDRHIVRFVLLNREQRVYRSLTNIRRWNIFIEYENETHSTTSKIFRTASICAKILQREIFTHVNCLTRNILKLRYYSKYGTVLNSIDIANT